MNAHLSKDFFDEIIQRASSWRPGPGQALLGVGSAVKKSRHKTGTEKRAALVLRSDLEQILSKLSGDLNYDNVAAAKQILKRMLKLYSPAENKHNKERK